MLFLWSYICSKSNHEGVIECETAHCTYCSWMTTIADSKRWSRDALNAEGQKDLSNLMKLKMFCL